MLLAILLALTPADLVLHNGRIYTMDPAHPVVTALAISRGRLVFAGSDTEAKAFSGRRVDLQGKTVLPGLIDAHAHLLSLGNFLRRVNLVGAKSYDEVIARTVKGAAGLGKDEWLQGRGWDQTLWEPKEFPTHDALSRAIPDRPVVLKRVDGHAVLANARAMQLAGITAATKDPDGGRIVRAAGGEPTGVFVDNAMELIGRKIPPASRDEIRMALLAAVAECNRFGLTAIHDAGEEPDAISVLEELARARKLNLREYVMISDGEFEPYLRRGPQSALYDAHLWIRSIKLYADGALGSRGAALLAPYSDDPGNTGLLVSQPEHLRAVAEQALRKGFQVGVHAIGDRGNRNVLDAYEAALAAVPVADHRFRVEHAQVLGPEDIPRFAKLGVIASMQATHQTSDMRWAEARLGPERVRGAYAWRSLLDSGAVVVNGTDFPVEQVDPLLTFHAAVTRQDPEGSPPGGWYPAQKMTRFEALRSMTLGAAWAGFQEKLIGSLTPGKLADFVVLDRDVMTVPDGEILKAQVLATYLAGKAVYSRQ